MYRERNRREWRKYIGREKVAKVARVARWPGPAARVHRRRDDGCGDGWTAAHDAEDRERGRKHDDAAGRETWRATGVSLQGRCEAHEGDVDKARGRGGVEARDEARPAKPRDIGRLMRSRPRSGPEGARRRRGGARTRGATSREPAGPRSPRAAHHEGPAQCGILPRGALIRAAGSHRGAGQDAPSGRGGRGSERDVPDGGTKQDVADGHRGRKAAGPWIGGGQEMGRVSGSGGGQHPKGRRSDGDLQQMPAHSCAGSSPADGRACRVPTFSCLAKPVRKRGRPPGRARTLRRPNEEREKRNVGAMVPAVMPRGPASSRTW